MRMRYLLALHIFMALPDIDILIMIIDNLNLENILLKNM